MRASLFSGFMLVLLVSACPADQASVHAVYELAPGTSEELGFFDAPWPSDARRTAAGTLDMSGFPNPFNISLVDEYLALLEDEIHGFGLQTPTYFRFDAPLEVASLPSLEESLEEGASVFLVDIDASSPQRGERVPVVVDFVEEASEYWPGNTLTVQPAYGAPLRESNRYAVVVTKGVLGFDGLPVQRPALVNMLLGFEPLDADALPLALAEETSLAALDELGVQRQDIVSFTSFTTQNVTREMYALRDYVDALPAPALPFDVTRMVDQNEDFRLLTGTFMSPQFMDGEVPFVDQGGRIHFDADGTPVQQGEFEVRFAVSLPQGDTPPNGWPVILYAHGTGGDWMSFVGETARRAARLGFAMVGVDQIHHGIRNPDDDAPELLVFNFFNPQAFRNNNRQSAVDLMALARFIIENPLDPRVLGEGFFFDASQLYFFGHSQGGINGPVYLAADDTARGGVLSGAGGVLPIALVDKVEPVNIPMLVATILRVQDPAQLRTDFPVFAALATAVEVSDPTLYVDAIARAPRDGFAAKHVMMTQGLTDQYTPPRSMEAMATSMGAPIVGDVLGEHELASLLGNSPVTSASGNVNGATLGVVQYPGGHFVAFEDEARDRIDAFFSSALAGVPTIE